MVVVASSLIFTEQAYHPQGMFPLKAFYWGHQGARDNFALQIRNLVEAGYRSSGERPVVIGECGIPMDLKLVYICPSS